MKCCKPFRTSSLALLSSASRMDRRVPSCWTRWLSSVFVLVREASFSLRERTCCCSSSSRCSNSFLRETRKKKNNNGQRLKTTIDVWFESKPCPKTWKNSHPCCTTTFGTRIKMSTVSCSAVCVTWWCAPPAAGLWGLTRCQTNPCCPSPGGCCRRPELPPHAAGAGHSLAAAATPTPFVTTKPQASLSEINMTSQLPISFQVLLWLCLIYLQCRKI